VLLLPPDFQFSLITFDALIDSVKQLGGTSGQAQEWMSIESSFPSLWKEYVTII
jgi:hypothetical protein